MKILQVRELTAEVEKERTKARQNLKRCLDLETEVNTMLGIIILNKDFDSEFCSIFQNHQLRLNSKSSETSIQSKKGVPQSAQSNRSFLDNRDSVRYSSE